MKVMCQTNDGFIISEKDLELRGSGDFFGTEQHGIPEFKIANLFEDMGTLKKVQKIAMEFMQMLNAIEDGKDGVDFVLVFKLSRFGRNAADVLSSLQLMQDYGVNLICVEEGIDSSKEAGKLLISIIAAVAELERENIRVQTMAGREQKAREARKKG